MTNSHAWHLNILERRRKREGARNIVVGYMKYILGLYVSFRATAFPINILGLRYLVELSERR